MRDDGFLIAVPGREAEPGSLQRQLNCRLGPDLSSRLVLQDTITLIGPALPLLPLPNSRGLVVGSLFRRYGMPAPVREQDARDLALIAERGAAALLDHYWGSYVALLHLDGQIQLLRDPSGAVPLYTCAADGTSFFAPDPAIFVRAVETTYAYNRTIRPAASGAPRR